MGEGESLRGKDWWGWCLQLDFSPVFLPGVRVTPFHLASFVASPID